MPEKEDALELTQDVFVTVFQKLEGFRKESDIKTWIYRITINKCLDFIKAKKRLKRLQFFTSTFLPNKSTPNYLTNFFHPGVALEDKQAVEHLFNLIRTLSSNQQTAWILHKLEHLTQEEVAQIMGATSKAVESRNQLANQPRRTLNQFRF